MLDMSTGHVTETDYKLLESNSEIPIRIINHDYGWMVSVGYCASLGEILEKCCEIGDFGLSESFVEIYYHAARCQCAWINFDRDSEPHKLFEVFNW